MLNITEIKTYIVKAINIFNEYFDGFKVPKIVVVSASRRRAVRNKVLQECGVPYKEDMYGTDGEVIDGPLGRQILFYQSMMKSEHQVCHALWHELGHILFGNEMFNMLNEQLKKDAFWKASAEFVEEFGGLFDKMYHIVYIS